MAINIVRYRSQPSQAVNWGVLAGNIYPIPGDFQTTAAFLSQARDAAFELAQALPEDGIDPDSVEILSPITNPCQILCQGANYERHMVESGMKPEDKKFNMIFNKSAGCLNDPTGDIVRPSHVKLLDYEIELGLVIGRQVNKPTTITNADLPKFVAALVIGNDISARDIQVPQMQFFKGKSYRTFCPVGPHLCLLEPDDFEYVHKLGLELKVNGETRQSDNTENLVFKPAATLTELSEIADLNVGDLVLTGTPAGCAMQAPSPTKQKLAALLPEAKKWKIFIDMQAKREQYLQPGDLVEAHISSRDGKIDLGTQRNRIVG